MHFFYISQMFGKNLTNLLTDVNFCSKSGLHQRSVILIMDFIILFQGDHKAKKIYKKSWKSIITDLYFQVNLSLAGSECTARPYKAAANTSSVVRRKLVLIGSQPPLRLKLWRLNRGCHIDDALQNSVIQGLKFQSEMLMLEK